MAYISQNFVNSMSNAGVTREQQEKIVAALAREPFIIAAVEAQRMGA